MAQVGPRRPRHTPLKLAFFHYPLHVDNGGEPTDTYLDGPNSLEGLLATNNVDIVSMATRINTRGTIPR